MSKNETRCACTHAKSRHRQEYGEPHKGPCRDCDCRRMEPIRKATPRDWDDFRDGRIG